MNIINVDKSYFNKNRINICNHYTSTEALISMISNKTLRFTHCEFLNDIEEYNYIFDLLEDGELKESSVYDFIKMSIENVGKDNANLMYLVSSGSRGKYKIKYGDYYVFSASVYDDSLPMWCYYSKDGNYYGYSIKFDINKIAISLKNENGVFLYGRVIYDRKEQVQIIKNKAEEIIKKLNDDLKTAESDEPYIDNAQDEFFEFIQSIRIFFKRSGFRHENEIRIVLLTNQSDNLKVGYNATNGVIRPYIECKFIEGLPIKGIKMSPSIDFESASRGLRYFLNGNGYDIDNDLIDSKGKKFISKSNIKLRF